jgi:outer membrane beta-barrel protein
MKTTILKTALLFFVCSSAANGQELYKRATDDKDNVKNKKFTKKSRLELDLPDVGFILNQSLVTTYLIHGGLTYFKDEEWGYGFEGSYGFNQDEDERTCLETFYNDPNNEIDNECGDKGDLPDDKNVANYGPAYMPIREIKYIVAANLVWNPVYGKQLLLLSATSYFDVFLTLGGGAIMSTYYDKTTELKNGKKSRADPIEQTDGKVILDGGAGKDETNSYGESGRPDPTDETHFFLNLGIGQKFHFWERYSIKIEFRNMTLLGTPGGFENLFAIWSGLGIRF